MVDPGFPPTAEDAKRAVKGYEECAGKAAATLKTMLGQVDDPALKARIETLIAQVGNLASVVRSAAVHYGPSDADIAQSFKSTVSAGGHGSVYGLTAREETPVAAMDLKDRFAEFVSHMGQADRCAKPLRQTGDEYHRLWIQLVNGAVELFHAIDRIRLG